ncbi:MAG: glycosyltransferase [Flavobacteriales bacterium]|nr:glycosyltransferase [Flavobacteriales bacterium]
MKKVAAFVYNNCKNDARVLKEASTLVDAGYDVRIYAILDKDTEPFEIRNGIRIIRVEKNPVHYRILRSVRYFFAGIRRGIRKTFFLLIRLFIIYPFRAISFVLRGFNSSEKSETSAEKKGIVNRVRGIGVVRFFRYYFRNRKVQLALFGWLFILLYYLLRFLQTTLSVILNKVATIIIETLKAMLMLFHRPLCFIDFYNQTKRLIIQEPADFYHGHDLHGFPAALLGRKYTGGNAIYDSHELYTEMSGLSKSERFFYRLVEKRIIAKADKVITVNKSIAEELAARYNVPEPTIILNCPPKPDFKENSKQDLLQEKVGYPTGSKVILYQGGYSPSRGLPNLILSMKHIEGAIMVFMGWGKIEEELRKLVAMENLSDKIYFTGPAKQEELLYYTKGADIGVIPYQFIGLNNYYCSPNKLFEYINANVAIVASDFPELKRVIEGYNIGKTFNPESSESIAKAINFILNGDISLDNMKRNTIKAAVEFNWENEAKKLLSLYNQLQ